jgi:phenylalanyl-tRNA synthetase alpha chain
MIKQTMTNLFDGYTVACHEGEEGVLAIDPTATAPRTSHRGVVHIYSQVIEEIENIFLSMGYTKYDGPEVEDAYHNFDALNIPQSHPARDMYDTLWLDKPGYLLRTHTSSVQIRAMRKHGAPLAGVVPGRTFRHESVDASHDIMFMQCEGIFVNKNVSMANLFGTAQAFLKAFFKKDELEIRMRPGYFPFVEPGVEIDMRCVFCTTGCSVCGKTTWLEIFPCGMIHPNVLQAVDIDAQEYQGFAFGFGLSRLVMLRHGIKDIRLLSSGKVEFLEQF